METLTELQKLKHDICMVFGDLIQSGHLTESEAAEIVAKALDAKEAAPMQLIVMPQQTFECKLFVVPKEFLLGAG